jgi:hypothetical protein
MSNLKSSRLLESLQYKDLEGLMKPTVHVDEFSSKMGDDDDIIVVSFFVRDAQAAKDLMMWFEKGYDFVIDADRSPGEIKPNRYLVYIELRRRSTAGGHLETIIDDLGTLTEFGPDDWLMHYKGKEVPFTCETFESMVPMSPRAYRERYDKDLNEVRTAAGLPVKAIYEKNDPAIQAIQAAAGLI